MSSSLLFPTLTALPSLDAWTPLIYLIIFLGMFVEGETVMFVSAFLIHRDLFAPWPVLTVAFGGLLISDILWFALGKKWANQPLLLKLASRIPKSIDEHIKNRPRRVIFISKFTYGLGRVILIRAGNHNLPFWLILLADIPAVLIWMVVVGGLGYFSSFSLTIIRHYLRLIEFGLLLALIFFFLIWRLVRNYSQKRL